MRIDAAAKDMPLGNRAELHRWRGDIKKLPARVTYAGPEVGLSAAQVSFTAITKRN